MSVISFCFSYTQARKYLLPCLLLLSISLSGACVAADFSDSFDLGANYRRYERPNPTVGPYLEELAAVELKLKNGFELHEANSIDMAIIYHDVGLELLGTNIVDQAFTNFKKAEKIYKSIYGKNSGKLAILYLDMMRTKLRKRATSIRYGKKALAIIEHNHGDKSVLYAEFSLKFGIFQSQVYRWKSAKKYLIHGYDIFVNTVGEKDVNTAIAAYYLASYFWYINNSQENTELYFQKALSSFLSMPTPDNDWTYRTTKRLYYFYASSNMEEEAYKQCVALAGFKTPPEDVEFLPIRRVAPRYPMEAAKSRIPGSVILMYDVNEKGETLNFRVVTATGPTEFKQAAVNAISQWLYRPNCSDSGYIVTKDVKSLLKFNMR